MTADFNHHPRIRLHQIHHNRQLLLALRLQIKLIRIKENIVQHKHLLRINGC